MLDPQTINPLELPSVLLEHRSQLPSTPCIYFAIDSLGTVQYIGRSNDIRLRWSDHHRCNDLEAIGGIKIAYLSVDLPRLLPDIESALIEWFKPPLNETKSLNPYGIGMKRLRLRSGKKAEEIAVELGLSFSTIQAWDQLKTAPRMTPLGLQKLMTTYKCSFEELVQSEKEMGRND